MSATPGPAAADLAQLAESGDQLWIDVHERRYESPEWKLARGRLQAWLHNNGPLILATLRAAAGLPPREEPWPTQNFSDNQHEPPPPPRRRTAEERVLRHG